MFTCPDILAPADEDLLSLVHDEGVLSTQEQTHFDHCSICRDRLASYSGLHDMLLSKLQRGLCPSAVSLNYYCLDMVPEAERVRLASHLLDCPPCYDEVAEIRRGQAAFVPFPQTSPTLVQTVRRLFATLVVQQAKLVTRGEAPTLGWPRQYQAETLDISLHISHQANGETMLLGILTSSDPRVAVDAFEGIEAELYPAPGPLNIGAAAGMQPLLTAQVDEIGNLLLEPVPTGEYVMFIRLPNQEIIIKDLQV